MAATITAQDVVNVAPELAAYALTPAGAAVILQMIGFAAERVDEAVWGPLYPYGLALMAAHMTLSTQPGLGGLVSGGGVVQSVSVGSVSKSFATSSSTRPLGAHGQTRPGMLYDEALAERVGPSFVYFGGTGYIY